MGELTITYGEFMISYDGAPLLLYMTGILVGLALVVGCSILLWRGRRRPGRL